MSELLAIEGLHAGYGATEILRGIDLAVGANEIVAVLGSNGAGNSTLNQTISGVLRPSGGEQQMLAIGRGLMAEPKLLILDEPSLGLSPLLVEELFALIKSIHTQGIALLLVEQNVVQSLEVAQRAYVLDNGAIVLQGDASDVRNDPDLK